LAGWEWGEQTPHSAQPVPASQAQDIPDCPKLVEKGKFRMARAPFGKMDRHLHNPETKLTGAIE